MNLAARMRLTWISSSPSVMLLLVRSAPAHWGFPDPASIIGSEEEILDAFKKVEMGLRNRIELLLDLPIDKLDHLQIKDELHSIHHKVRS
jgi:arsenate reductase (thioredoxin)